MKTRWYLLGIFLIVLTIRLFLAFSAPHLTYESYFHLRHVEHILQSGLPLFEDSLSYSGRERIFLPFFHYFMALFALIIPLELVALLLPNLLLASLPLIVYALSRKVTGTAEGALLSSLAAGFLPLLFQTNSFTPLSLFLPLLFLTVYAFLNIGTKKYLHLYLLCFFLLSLTTSFTVLLLAGFGIYLLLSLLEREKIRKQEIEVILFSVFFFVWVQFLFFKQTLINQGLGFIWQNIPQEIISEYFPTFSIAEAMLLVGIVPFLAGIFVVYRSLFSLKDTKTFLLISLVISTSMISWLRLVRFEESLAIFGLVLAVLFASFYGTFSAYMEKTRFPHLLKTAGIILIVLLTASSVPPAIAHALAQETPSDADLAAMDWIKNNTPPDARILVSLKEGHLLAYHGQRRNIMDDQFTLIPDVEERFTDINTLFTTAFETQALELLEKYNVSYIVSSIYSRKQYGNGFRFTGGECFTRVYRNETKIYNVRCLLEESP